ncbi:unnamed protein product [Paramecium sonneborni]|uniref:Uncharacterized protein n=1 Tax=Paramecium sonneborni TaxID=65129 RepID=A0A8S1LV31_9CILI|nr:unnamed protein product [Paramecium sonneborni]
MLSDSQIDNIHKIENEILRIKTGHLIKFDEFDDDKIDQEVLVYIDKKVINEYIMKLKYEIYYNVE